MTINYSYQIEQKPNYHPQRNGTAFRDVFYPVTLKEVSGLKTAENIPEQLYYYSSALHGSLLAHPE